MSHEQNNLLVNDEELKLLNKLIISIEDVQEKKLNYDISSPDGADVLLPQLGSADKLQLVAYFGDHHLVFPVRTKVGDFGNVRMTIDPPQIFETGDHLRAWRFPVSDKTIPLVNEDGEELGYKVKDLSASGISFLIEEKDKQSFPAVLHNIYLQLPNKERLAITGSLIRRIDEQTVAYSLTSYTRGELLSSLTQYLSERHAEQHPETHLK